MRKSFVIVGILLLAAAIATLWVFLEGLILKKTHPLPYTETVEKYAEQYAVPEEILYAVMYTESSFKSDAVSDKGAIGLMQITPDTFEWLCRKSDRPETDAELLFKPETNIAFGAAFLSLLYSEYGNWDTVYAAYNAGRTKVNEWLSDPSYSRDGSLVSIPYAETRAYVKKVASAAAVYRKLYFEERADTP